MTIKGKHAQAVCDYVEGIINGSIVANNDCILAAKRFVRMVEDPRYEVRTQDADFVIGIIQSKPPLSTDRAKPWKANPCEAKRFCWSHGRSSASMGC